ncbi:unnamed protein product [Kluyveromyces dobzhanskii CBS 2104]|uniref:alpha-1,2-Mannosidase n=1 Tax=Kluyveromyces dobzhanskii CBS 2104 TaxID=1427455 RepID=A0A0A8L224_9SACH|nr:unnamed protein product [Kluyveromyces dobzhanskii CBS 2104]
MSMKCISLWYSILALFVRVALSFNAEPYSFTKSELSLYKEQVRELFYHGYNSYLEYGYPFDEVHPIECVPRKRKFNDPDDINTNDVLGNFTTTLVDTFSTLAVLGDKKGFADAIHLFHGTVPESFDLDSTVQVFETTIRLLGGMMSAHIYATDPRTRVYLGEKEYDGFLLRRCVVLGDKLLQAYLSPTGLPVPRINLRYGTQINPKLIEENNAAATASPLFEFRLLSMLTLNDTYREVAEFAFNRTWELRSDLNLIPMSFSPYTNTIYDEITGIGASIDSFYETALKGSILFDDPWLYSVWETAIHALNAYSKSDWFYSNTGTTHGTAALPWVDALSAFFPGLLTLDGRLEDARKKHLLFSKLWSTYGGIPERWNFVRISPDTKGNKQGNRFSESVDLEWYPLRPEFIESTYYLYRATKDVYYLNVGVRILHDLQHRFKARCGFAGIQNVITGEAQDRMESFVLGETLKYLFLLFDEDNELHTKLWEHVFSTEAHPLWVNTDLRSRYLTYRKTTDGDRDVSETFKFHLQQATDMAKRTRPHRRPIDSAVTNFHGQCVAPQMAYSTGPPNRTGFQDSDVLSDPRLFEIDFRYALTLKNPAWNKGYVPLEMTPELQTHWSLYNTKKCSIPTTRAFEGTIGSRDHDSRLISVHRWTPTVLIYRFHCIYGMKISFVDELWEWDSRWNSEGNSPSSVPSPVPFDLYDVLNHKSCAPKDNGPVHSYTAKAIDGIDLGDNDYVVVNKTTLFIGNSKSEGYASYNRKSQLLVNCIPITNIYLM